MKRRALRKAVSGTPPRLSAFVSAYAPGRDRDGSERERRPFTPQSHFLSEMVRQCHKLIRYLRRSSTEIRRLASGNAKNSTPATC
jgi:hypothetical protein